MILADCTIHDNAADSRGSGVFLVGGGTVTGCVFLANRGFGSAFSADSTNVFLLNSCFLANEGQGARFAGGTPTVVGCIFVGNDTGVGISNHAFPALFNCTIADNVVGISNGQSGVTSLTNCIVWGNLARPSAATKGIEDWRSLKG